MPKEENLSSELIAHVKEIIAAETDVDFEEMFELYSENPDFLDYREGRPLTEADLIADILDDGEYQGEEGDDLNQVVTTGVLIISASLGLI
ncbi:MAG: hypothetical protein ABFQ62_01430 [Patescibacteria group bacterium]